jgi:lipoprotein-anchoring transpeptidase ErfK/SrfK
MTLPAITSFGSARALPVSDRRDGWLEVQLPTRPNGSTGWVRATGVPLRTVSFEVRVDLSDRTLEVLEDGDQVLQTSAAIGTAVAPTPTGRFFVVDKVESTSSAYGPFALGLSGHSEVLSEFGGGDGQIGIHGTDDPSSIGRAASQGCVRVPNDVITRLAELLPLGTPVVVVG